MVPKDAIPDAVINNIQYPTGILFLKKNTKIGLLICSEILYKHIKNTTQLTYSTGSKNCCYNIAPAAY